jgi:hypothetical protein
MNDMRAYRFSLNLRDSMRESDGSVLLRMEAE